MRTFITFILLCCVIGVVHSQVGINTTNPNAVLEVRASNTTAPANTDGLLIPKIDNFPASNPTAAQHGMLVFATGGGTPSMGFYYWRSNTSSWIKLSTSLDTEWIDNGTYLSPIDGNTKDVAIGGTNRPNTKFTVKSNSNQTIAYFSNEFAPPLTSIIKGLYTEMGTIAPISGNVTTYLNHNKLSQNNGNLYGEYNELTALFDVMGNNPDSIVGNYNKIRGGSSIYIGSLNDIDKGDNETYGVYNKLLVGNNGGNRIGVKNEITGSLGANFHIGVENILKGNSYSERYGTKNLIIEGNAGNSLNAYGSYNLIESSGTGDKFGSFDSIPHTVPGKHYGVYSSATKVGSYAGYFLGTVSIGTNASNAYSLPVSAGGANTIIVSNGVGGSNWTNPNVLPFWGLAGNSGTDPNAEFLGTTDNVNLRIRTNNIERMEFAETGIRFLNANGNVSIGSTNFSGYNGSDNVMIGNGAGGVHTGSSNVSIGNSASGLITSGSNNIALGDHALYNNTTGRGNIAFGYQAADNLQTIGAIIPNKNIVIGHNIDAPVDSGSNQLNIGNIIYGVNVDGTANTISTGNLGIGIQNPQERLDVNGAIRLTTTATNSAVIKNDDNFNHTTDNNLDFGNDLDSWTLSSREGTTESSGIHGDGDFVAIWSPADSNRMLRLLDEDAWGDNDGNPYNNSAEIAYVDAAGQFVQASDRNRKEDIQKINQALQKISEINGYTYKFKDKSKKRVSDKKTSGVIAQELYEVLPEAVQVNENGEYFVHYAGIIPLLIEGIKEQQEEIKLLKKEIEYLKQLEQHLKALEQSIDN